MASTIQMKKTVDGVTENAYPLTTPDRVLDEEGVSIQTKVDAKYTKPSTGIPKTDLSSDVQTSLGKADTALQEHQDISGKADKVTGATNGDFASLDANGNLTDSGMHFGNPYAGAEITDAPVVYNRSQSLSETEKATVSANIDGARKSAANTFTAENTFSGNTNFDGINTFNGNLKALADLIISELSKFKDTNGNSLIVPNTTDTPTASLSAIKLGNIIYKLSIGGLAVASYSELVALLNASPAEKYDVGQNFFVITLEVPDIWISANNESTAVTYTYVSDAQFIADVNAAGGALQIGYHKVSFLETQKVDLTNYVQKTDIATTTEVGPVKIDSTYGVKAVNQTLQTVEASEAELVAKTDENKVVTPDNIDIAVREGLGNSEATWTEAYQEAARLKLGFITTIIIDD